MSEEKVCLTSGQIENIGKAYASEIEGKKVKGLCPKATKWVRGFFGKKKKKKVQKEQDAGEWVARKALSRITSKVNDALDRFF